jgi:hypothetical protein
MDAYTRDDWRRASSSVEMIMENRWTVFADCPACDLRLRADLRRLAEIKGRHYSLWGADAPCRRVGCIGRVQFVLRPPGSHMDIVMTAKATR